MPSVVSLASLTAMVINAGCWSRSGALSARSLYLAHPTRCMGKGQSIPGKTEVTYFLQASLLSHALSHASCQAGTAWSNP